MSRKTKRKTGPYYLLNNGQVVRHDTMETDRPVQKSVTKAKQVALPVVQHPPLDLDHTRKHREEK